MERIVPLDKPYEKLAKIEQDEDKLVLVSTIFTVIVALIEITSKQVSQENINYEFYCKVFYILKVIFNFAGIIVIICVFWKQLAFKTLHSALESKRRLDLIDNAFDINLSGIRSKGYFTNDHLEPSLYKLAVNAFHNVVFTEAVIDLMKEKIYRKNFILGFVFLVAVFFGDSDSIVVFFQASLPLLLLQKAYVIREYNDRMKEVLGSFKEIFSSIYQKGNTEKAIKEKMPVILKNIIMYESTISWASIKNDSNIFKSIDETKEEEWRQLKNEYGITQ